MRKCFVGGVAFVLCLLLNATVVEATTTYFPLTDTAPDGNELWASATATVTSGVGYVEVLLVNTSPRQDNFAGTGDSANPFIVELEIDLNGYNLDGDNESTTSYAESTESTRFAQGAGSAAIIMSPAVRDLYYKMIDGDSPGMDKCLMFGEADNLRNDNAIGSMDALDGSYIPQEDFATGYLNTSPYPDSGAVFDVAVFHFVLDPIDVPDTIFYTNPNTLVVKFQGGGDYSMHVENVPEPATLLLLGFGAVMLRRKRRT